VAGAGVLAPGAAARAPPAPALRAARRPPLSSLTR
jgi:hypothetical protein